MLKKWEKTLLFILLILLVMGTVVYMELPLDRVLDFLK